MPIMIITALGRPITIPYHKEMMHAHKIGVEKALTFGVYTFYPQTPTTYHLFYLLSTLLNPITSIRIIKAKDRKQYKPSHRPRPKTKKKYFLYFTATDIVISYLSNKLSRQ